MAYKNIFWDKAVTCMIQYKMWSRVAFKQGIYSIYITTLWKQETKQYLKLCQIEKTLSQQKAMHMLSDHSEI